MESYTMYGDKVVEYASKLMALGLSKSVVDRLVQRFISNSGNNAGTSGRGSSRSEGRIY